MEQRLERYHGCFVKGMHKFNIKFVKMALDLLFTTDTVMTHLDNAHFSGKSATDFDPIRGSRDEYDVYITKKAPDNVTTVNLLDKMCIGVFEKHIGKLIIQVKQLVDETAYVFLQSLLNSILIFRSENQGCWRWSRTSESPFQTCWAQLVIHELSMLRNLLDVKVVFL